MSAPARLSLRAPPHLPFVQGWPGIPPSENPPRKPAGVHGTVEVRTAGATGIKARWVRVELRKHETLPSSAANANPWEHVGEIVTLWQTPQGQEWGTLETADFKFFLPLPENIPPTVDLLKNGGVRYELVAALCYRQKGGLFKSESAPITKISEPLMITKHELHSAWPLYNVTDTRQVSAPSGNLSISRPARAVGPTDRILLTATLRSTHTKNFKLKGFDVSLTEILTLRPQPAASTKGKKAKPAPPPITKTRIVASIRVPVDEKIAPGGEKSARIEMVVPPDKVLLTVKNAKTMDVEYELDIKAVCDGVSEALKIGGWKYVVGPFPRAHAQQAVK
jgi:hypothetical protein